MITRTTTVGNLKNYRYNLNRANNHMSSSMNTVITQRLFNSYAEDPAIATRCFQLRRSYMRTTSQLTVNDSLCHKYDVAWQSLSGVSQDLYAIADDTAFGSIIRSENEPDATGRNALGQSMSAKAKNIVQTMNGQYGENYVFGGADTLRVPLTWEPRVSENYIPPDEADPTNEEHAPYYQFLADPAKVAAGVKYTNNPSEAAEYTADEGGGWKINEAYDSTYSCKYLKMDGTGTNNKSEAATELYYRGVRVDSNDPEDLKKMEYFMLGERKDMDIGIGHKEDENGAVSSSVFNSALQGAYYLGGYGKEEVEVTVGTGDRSYKKTIEIPNNIVSVVARMGEILQRCDPDNGDFASPEDEAECQALAEKFEDQKNVFIERWTAMDTESSYLQDNSKLLINKAESLSTQFMGMEDADPAAAISEYMFARYCFDSALKVGNSVLSQSLMDYMSL